VEVVEVVALSVGVAGLAVEVVVIGAPPPVSVAVVPVVDGWRVSVEPAVLSGAGRPHAAQTASRAMARTLFMPGVHSKCGTVFSGGLCMSLARVLKGFGNRGVA